MNSICFTRSDFGCPITPRHFLPKVATVLTPVLGIFLGGYYCKQEIKNFNDLSTKDKPLFKDTLTSVNHRNHYKIAILTNLLLSAAAAITTVALGILSPFLGVPLAIVFGGLAISVIPTVKKGISQTRQLEKMVAPPPATGTASPNKENS